MTNQSRITSWLYPAVLLCATLCGAFCVLQRPSALWGWALGGLVGAVALWILISALIPSTSKQLCPACGEPGMRRISETAKYGARCAHCRHEDAEQSAFLLAEELAEEEGRFGPDTSELAELATRAEETRMPLARPRARSLRS